MMKINNIIFFLLSIIFSIKLSADSFFIEEPIFESEIFIQTIGDSRKDALIFVHGLGDEASAIWEESVNRLKDKYFILTFDLPGFGKSSKDSKEYSPKNYSLLIEYLRLKYIRKPSYLIGHSMGGAISLKYTSMYPENVKSLFLIDAAGILHKDAYSDFLIKLKIDKYFQDNFQNVGNKISNFLSKITDVVNKVMPNDLSTLINNEYTREQIGSPTAIAAIGLMMENFSYSIKNINTKTLIIWGENDKVASLRAGYLLNKLIPNSTLKIIPLSGHVPIIDSKIKYFNYLDDFLNDRYENKIIKKNLKAEKDLLIQNKTNIKVENAIYESIKIINSTNIQLNNISVKNILVQNSNISIINSKIHSDILAMEIKHSKVEITASDILSEKDAIKTQSSRIDIAGSNIDAKKYGIININERNNNHIIFSITNVNSILNKDKMFHKKITIKGDEKI